MNLNLIAVDNISKTDSSKIGNLYLNRLSDAEVMQLLDSLYIPLFNSAVRKDFPVERNKVLNSLDFIISVAAKRLRIEPQEYNFSTAFRGVVEAPIFAEKDSDFAKREVQIFTLLKIWNQKNPKNPSKVPVYEQWRAGKDYLFTDSLSSRFNYTYEFPKKGYKKGFFSANPVSLSDIVCLAKDEDIATPFPISVSALQLAGQIGKKPDYLLNRKLGTEYQAHSYTR